MSKKMAIRLRKFGRLCPITGYKEGAIKVGSNVVVLTDRGVEFGQIIEYTRGLPKKLARDVRLKKVLRYATNEDVIKERQLAGAEEEARTLAKKKYREYDAPIKSIDVEYVFDKSRVVFYYKLGKGKKAPNLKDLKRDLSRILKAKVDMRQVNPRDEAMMYGGLGPCGKPLCCAAWLERPRHVTVKMVKDQGLQISPMRTSGLCGRLMCCLEYEHQGKKKGGEGK
jgi:cell fate regulator YaaT (PSP1 superfamily)